MQPDLNQLATQLSSTTVSDRVLAMLELQKDAMPADLAFPLIQQALSDNNIQVRGMAVFSLGIKPTPANVPILVDILATDPDYNLRAMAAGALGYLGDVQALEALQRAFFEDSNWLVQFSVAVALGNLRDDRAIAVLLEALASDITLLREAAIMALGEVGAVEHVDRLLPFIHAEDWLIRQRLAEALGNLSDDRSRAALKQLQTDSHPHVCEAATRSLVRLGELA